MSQPLRNLLIRLHDATPDEVPDLLAGLQAEEVASLLETAKKEKLFLRIYPKVVTIHPIPEPYQQFFERVQSVRDETLRVMRVLNEHLPEDARFLIVKGPALRPYYPHRHSVDLDLCVPSIEHLWTIASTLLDHELEQVSTMLLAEDPDQRTIYGRAKFDTDIQHDLIEVQIGSFSMGVRTHLPWDVFARNSKRLDYEDMSIPVPNLEGAALIYLAELITRPRLHLRDLFDAQALFAERPEEMDLAYLAQQAEAYHLIPSLARVHSRLLEEELFDVPPRLQTLLSMIGVPEGYRYRGIWRNHILPYLRKQTQKPFRNLLYAFLRHAADQLNDKERLLPMLKRFDLRYGALPFFRNGVFSHFMKVNSSPGPWQWQRIKEYDVVSTPIGHFIACNHVLYGDEELDLVQALIEE